MPTLSADIIQVLSIFTIAVTMPTFAKMLVLLQGTILTPGRRTITASSHPVHLVHYIQTILTPGRRTITAALRRWA
jgi:hypothetical protein